MLHEPFAIPESPMPCRSIKILTRTRRRCTLVRKYVIVYMYIATLILIVIIVQARAQGACAGGFFVQKRGGVRAYTAELHVIVALLSVVACMYLDCRCAHPAGMDSTEEEVR